MNRSGFPADVFEVVTEQANRGDHLMCSIAQQPEHARGVETGLRLPKNFRANNHGIGRENDAARSSKTHGPGFLLGHSSGEYLRTLAPQRKLGNVGGPDYKLNASIPQQLLPAR
jgi:hypothetical protein